VGVRHINVNAKSSASPEAIYSLLIDGATWPCWSPIETFELEHEGDPAPEGVGAIRAFRRGRTTGRDEILELVPARRIRYASLSGVPVRDYVGTVELEPVDDGTIVHWDALFTAKVPGTGVVVERALRRFLERCVTGLAKYSSRAPKSIAP
jgi:uncharacterized protein YndB with AHSA1/START domain